MNPEVFKRINTSVLYPPFFAKLQKLHDNCAARGAFYYVTSGNRTYAEQDALYAQGRTKPGQVVTKAKGGQSLHNFAIAVDWCRDGDPTKPGLQPDWSPAAYKILAEEAEKLGLEAGLHWVSFQDPPHIQLNFGKLGLTLADLQKAYAAGGYPEVFKKLDAAGGNV